MQDFPSFARVSKVHAACYHKSGNPHQPSPAASGQQARRAFLAGGPSKAFAVTGTGAWGYVTGMFNQQLAVTAAVANCSKANHDKTGCRVVNR